MPQKHTGKQQTTFRPSCINRVSVFEWHKRFKEGRVSVRDDERCGRSKKVNTLDLIRQRVRGRVRVTMLRLYGSSARDSVGRGHHSSNQAVAFPRGQCTSPQLHPCHRLFDQDRHQDSSSLSLLSRPCSLWLLVIP